MFQPDQIVRAVCTAFQGDAAMTILAPGGIWHRRAPSGILSAGPYVVLDVLAGPKETFSDKTCLQDFSITLTIYGGQDVVTSGEIADKLCDWDLSRSIFDAVPAKIVGLFPDPEGIDLNSEEKSGQDVVLAVKKWTLKLHYQIGSNPEN